MSCTGTSGTWDHEADSPLQPASAASAPTATSACVARRSCDGRTTNTASAISAIAPADVNADGK